MVRRGLLEQAKTGEATFKAPAKDEL